MLLLPKSEVLTFSKVCYTRDTMKRTILIFSILFFGFPLMGMWAGQHNFGQAPFKKHLIIDGPSGRWQKTMIDYVKDAKKNSLGDLLAITCFTYENNQFSFLGDVFTLSPANEQLIDEDKWVFISQLVVSTKLYRPIPALIIGTADEEKVEAALPALRELIETEYEKTNNNK